MKHTKQSAHGQDANNGSAPGIIWITGFSASGKTTVARRVVASLQDAGVATVFLDGDDLRSILGGHWGYSRADRIEISHVYFRLCSHLANQGFVVVISAVAMYREIRDWVRTHIPRNLQVYLQVPEAERRRRDAATKKIYGDNDDFGQLYDEPINEADLVVENDGRRTPEEVASEILLKFQCLPHEKTDRGRNSYWNSYYFQSVRRKDPSAFARSVSDLIPPRSRLLEVGCGDGVDARHFASRGHAVTAIDLSSAAIEICKRRSPKTDITFLATTLPELQTDQNQLFTAIFTRLALNAMPLAEEVDFFRAAWTHTGTEGRLFIECYSIEDVLAREGLVISPSERLNDRYWRFLVRDELVQRIQRSGFEVIEQAESSSFAEPPREGASLIRIIARKAPPAG